MTIKEFYEKINGNYEEVLSRLSKEDRVKRFAIRFFCLDEEDDIGDLEKAIQNQDANNIFEYAHKIKGNSLNIGYTELAKYSSIIVEEVRAREIKDISKLDDLFSKLKSNYYMIKEYAEQIE